MALEGLQFRDPTSSTEIEGCRPQQIAVLGKTFHSFI